MHPGLDDAPPSAKALSFVFWISVALAGLTAAYAVSGARDLSYDGCYYLLSVAIHRDFQFWEPARQSVHFLQQLFAVSGVRSGVNNLWTLAQLFSLGASGWPVLITALCWFVLPRDDKSWIAGPLLNLVFAIPTTSFAGISEGIIGSCLLWLAFLLACFCMKRPLGAFTSMVATALCAFVHESAVLGLAIIAVVAANEFRHTQGWARMFAAATAILAVAEALNMFRLILFPLSTIERANFLSSTMSWFFGTVQAPNLSALASLAAAGAITVALLRPNRFAIAAAAGCFSLFALFLAMQFAMPDAFIAPSRFFAARGLPVALTTLIAAWLLWLQARGITPARFATRPVLALILGLCVTQAAMQVEMTARWNDFVRDVTQFVRSPRGAVSHGQALLALDPSGARFRRDLLDHWSIEPLSILLAPAGRVVSVIEPPPTARWIPFRLNASTRLPVSPLLDWSGFSPEGAR